MTKKRPLNSDEKETLQKMLDKLSNKPRLNWLLVAFLALVGLSSGAYIYYYDYPALSFICKMLVCASPIGIWVIVELYFDKKKENSKEKTLLENLLAQDVISVAGLEVKRAAKLGEHEDEGTMYLIEMKDNQCVWLWDFVYELEDKNSLPEYLEIYTGEDALGIFGLVAKREGKSITCSFISTQDKWDYFEKTDWPDQLEISKKGFDDLMLEIQY